MRPEGFPPGKAYDSGRLVGSLEASMRPEGFPPGKGCDRATLLRSRYGCRFNEAGRFPSRKKLHRRGTAD